MPPFRYCAHNLLTLFTGEGLSEALAVLGRYRDAIASAEAVRSQFPFNPFLQLHARGVIGRSLAELIPGGGTKDIDTRSAGAQAALVLSEAIAEARRVKLPFIELMLTRDLIGAAGEDPTSVSALRRLGIPLRKLVAGPEDLDQLLGPGFSAAAVLQEAEYQ